MVRYGNWWTQQGEVENFEGERRRGIKSGVWLCLLSEVSLYLVYVYKYSSHFLSIHFEGPTSTYHLSTTYFYLFIIRPFINNPQTCSSSILSPSIFLLSSKRKKLLFLVINSFKILSTFTDKNNYLFTTYLIYIQANLLSLAKYSRENNIERVESGEKMKS